MEYNKQKTKIPQEGKPKSLQVSKLDVSTT